MAVCVCASGPFMDMQRKKKKNKVQQQIEKEGMKYIQG